MANSTSPMFSLTIAEQDAQLVCSGDDVELSSTNCTKATAIVPGDAYCKGASNNVDISSQRYAHTV